ncbi:MAG: DUF2505 family protein [Acidimicrobiia bacterium]
MRFEVQQSFGADADAVARAYADPELYGALTDLPGLGRPEVVDHRARGGTVHLDVRWRFTGALSPAVTAVVDPDRLSWIERSVHDLEARTTRIELHPDHYADRLRCSAQAEVVPDGPGARRSVHGDLRVRALLVAGAVERAIVSGLRDSLTAQARAVDGYVEARSGG